MTDGNADAIPDAGHADADADEPAGPAPDPAQRFVVVGVGASAGGLEALETFLRRFTLDAMALVIVQHLLPEQPSNLHEILQRWTTLRVLQAADGARVERNHAYVIPPGVDLALLRGVLHLIPASPPRPKQPIDFFFRSLAEDRGRFCAGVVLSGTGTDGTLGIKAIRAAGGLTFAQEPATARFDGMPRSAIESGEVDFTLSPEGIADELGRTGRHTYLAPGRWPRGEAPERLAKILVLLRDACGLDLSLYKYGTIERRVARRMAVHKIERLDDYVTLVRASPKEVAALCREVLIGVTSFFRDGEPFEALASQVFPALAARRKPNASIRIWVPGCSTGEEPYSVAIALLEYFDTLGAHPRKIQLFATDVHHDAVQFARRGVYPLTIAADVSPERLERFFVARPGGYQVSRRVRSLVVFATQNVTKDPPFSRLDLVSCRNLLIYFQPVLQKKVLRIFHHALAPEGALLLGTSESVGDAPDLFSLVDRRNKLYRKKDIASKAIFDTSFGERGVRGEDPTLRPPPEVRTIVSIQQLADRRTLERYAPPGVVINEQFEVLQFRGKTGPYLEPTGGTPSLNLLKLARPELVATVRAAVLGAAETSASVSGPSVALRDEHRARSVRVEVLPLVDPVTATKCFLVLFVENPTPPSATIAPVASGASGAVTPPDPRVQEVERELATTKEYFQGAVEELESSNEELKSSNEELQSANEELQSTNEEFETSQEELQSTNEELTTMNDELNSRLLETAQQGDDLQNVLAAIDLPVVLVGKDLRLRRFSRAAERLLNVSPSDVGRPVAHLSWFIAAGSLERVVNEAIERGVPSDEELATCDGRRFRVSAVPYRATEQAIKGAVLSFVPGGPAAAKSTS